MVDSLKKFCSRILQDECFVKERSQNKTKNRAAIVIRDKLISRTWYMERDTWYNDLNDHLTQFLTDVKNDKHEWPRSDTTSYIQNQTSENFILNAPVQTQSKKKKRTFRAQKQKVTWQDTTCTSCTKKSWRVCRVRKGNKSDVPGSTIRHGTSVQKKHLYQSRIPRNRITSIKKQKNTRKSIKDNNSTKTAKLTRTNQIPTHSSMHILQKSRPALNLHKK